MNRLLLVTTELHPEVPGGAGVVVDTIGRGLGAAILLLTPRPPSALSGRPGVEVHIRRLAESGFMKRSETVARAVAELAQPGDRIEFQDFEGIGYLALTQRSDLSLDRVTMTVRFHGPYDMLAEAMDTVPDEWNLARAMEREVFRMADAVLVPVEEERRLLIERYDLESDRVLLAPPPIPELPVSTPMRTDVPVFTVLGRLGEMKGSQDMVEAAVALLEQGRRLRVRFVGGDGWSPTGGSTMTEWLTSRIPDQHQGSIVFVGPANRDELAGLITDSWAVVVPSRFESFCLAAYEARMMGHPVIVPDLPAFRGLFHEETGALVYDGTVPGLIGSMTRIIDNAELVQRLASSPLPQAETDWAEAYDRKVEPRHPRAQAGLATSATRRVNEIWEASRAPHGSRGMQALYRLIPQRVADLAVRVVPRSLKETARTRASWPAEAERRALQARLDEVHRRTAAGEFPDVDDPEVTVVVPVFNDIRYLEEALASVYEQTHDSWEIVLVDDGSTDPATVEYLGSLRRPRLRVRRQENTGLPGARNTGMRMARGRYLIPLDSDDQLEPEFMTRTVTALEAHPKAGFAHGYALLHHDVDAFFVTRPFNPYWQLLGNGVAQCGLIRAEAWESVGGYDETMVLGHEDWDFWMRLMEARWGQVQLTEVLYKYRKHGVSMSVDAESRFEQARRMVRDRHPRLYGEVNMRRFKKRWFPMVTVIADQNQDHDDWEFVTEVGALGSTWGKFVVDARGLDPFPVKAIEELAEALETEPKAARAVTTGLPPLLMTRRWNLHDRMATPDRVIVLEEEQVGPEPSVPVHLPRPGWEVPPQIEDSGLPIQRTNPEEDARMPDPYSW